MIRQNQQSGYIALIAVLIIGAASVAIAVGTLTLGADATRTTLANQQSAQARSLANACAEEALQVVHDSTSYTGTNSLTLGAGGCSYTVANTGGSNRVIDTTGTVNNIVRKVKVYVTIGSSSISVTSWQEVADAS